jgi:hypothetical protein
VLASIRKALNRTGMKGLLKPVRKQLILKNRRSNPLPFVVLEERRPGADYN